MAANGYTVRVKGYKECVRALNRVDANTKRELKGALEDAARPVSKDAQQRLSGYRGINTGSIVPRAVVGGVFVTQRQKKKTGQHPDFGALQMREGLIPALEANADNIERGVDHAVGVLIGREGF